MSKAALIHLAEECGELTQAAIKAVRFGKTARNKEDLIVEAGDVLALIEILVAAGVLDTKQLSARKRMKTAEYTRYLKGKK